MSFYDDAKFMFLAGGAAGKDGKVYNIKPRQKIIGEELITNGTFDTDSDWTKVGESTISGGKGNIISTAGVWSNINQPNVFTVGKHYRVALDVTVNSNAADYAIKIQDGGTAANIGLVTTSGSYEFFYTAEGTTLYIARYSTDSAVDASIDNVSVKEVEGVTADFTFERGTDLTATRVGKDGYIEKGREQLLVNTVWAGAGEDTQPTSWSKSLTADGTFDTTSTDGQIRFQAPTSSDRAFLTTPDISETGVLAQSVFVDAVDVVCQVDTLMRNNTGASATRIGIFEDGVEVTTTENVKAGKRYTVVWNKTANTRFRFGIGCDGGRAGDITLSRPQLEYGLAATSYIENTSTSATATAGLLEDEPRFDYTGGGCPALLIEGNAINLVKNSEYFGDYLTSSATVTQNALVSPEGLQNASTVDVTSNAGSMYTQSGDDVEYVTASTVYTFSFYVKQGTNTENYLAVRDNTGGVFIDTDVAYTASSSEWTRVEHTFTTPAGCTSVRLYPQRYSSGGQGTTHIWGMQLEANDYATSYIPTYGVSASRSYDDPNDLVHGITMGTSCSFFLEATNFKVTEMGGAQTSFLQIMDAVSPSTSDRLLFLGVANTASTFTLQAQNKKSGETTVTLSKTLMTMGSPFKALARYDGTSFDLFVNGVLEDSATIVADDHFGRVGLKNLTSQTQNGHSISQVILFDSALSTNDSEIITGTSYSTFGQMASELSYTEYE